ncbi:MAG: DNA polymerase I [Candidatus Omnitrophica bacterium]|nr:DNA polymerase I [Candidatus Omnitrophota bacterium]
MKLFLIDGNSFCYRAFYAIKELANSKGEPTNAVFGFISMLRKIIKDEKPDYLAITFDLKGPTFRHKKYEEYKIHRKPMPDPLVSQMPVIKEVVRAYNVPIFEKEGFEADDVIATLTRKLAGKSLDVYIVTGDKDALQLVGPHVKVYSTHKEGLIYDAEKVKERYGVGPERIVDLLSLMGDATDNITGIPGFGEKTALSLMKEFENLDEILTKPEKIKSEVRRRLVVEHADKARLSKELATLDDKVPVDIELEDMRIKEPDALKLLEIFKRLEFRNLIQEYAPKTDLKSKYYLVKDKKNFADLLKKLEKSELFAFDFETTGTDPMTARPIGISFSFKKGEAYYAAFKNETPKLINDSSVSDIDRGAALEALRPIFENGKIKKVGQNIKYEYVILRNCGINLRGICFDTMIASYLLNPSKLNHNLDDIAMEYLSYKAIPIESLIGKGKSAITLEDVDIEKVSEYSSEDADVTFRVMMILEKQLKEKGLDNLFNEVEMPLVAVLAEMEIAGVAIDTKFLLDMSVKVERSLGGLTKEIYAMAGEEFNINSHQQLASILFEKLKLPVIKRTKTGISTDESVLKKLVPNHAIIALILEYRTLSKLKSTYIDSLPELINKKTGKVHTSFNQTVTATGRLSSSDPNLQNIPIKTEIGREMRRAFIPFDKDDILISADYSQIELRILAHLSGDKDLVSAFKKNHDIHTYTASLVFGVKEKDVTKKMRSQAKTVNFGIVYGMSPYGLSRDLGIGVADAEKFIENYFERYSGVKAYLQDTIETARKAGYVTTILNRRRYIPDINSQNMNIRQFAERVAINTPIQGSAADLIKVAMLNIWKEFEKRRFKSKMVLQVHDELVFEARKEEAGELKEIIKKEMEGVFKLEVPIIVRIGEGRNWLETEK